jgi:hypothetical protein
MDRSRTPGERRNVEKRSEDGDDYTSALREQGRRGGLLDGGDDERATRKATDDSRSGAASRLVQVCDTRGKNRAGRLGNRLCVLGRASAAGIRPRCVRATQ